MENPAVTILMAVYKPNREWLREQLVSLNAQEYAPIQLLVWNDCPGDTESDVLIEQEIKKFSVQNLPCGEESRLKRCL